MKLNKLLIISYYFEPSPTVSSKRLSYWAFYLAQFYDVEVMTSTANPLFASPYKDINTKIKAKTIPAGTSVWSWLARVCKELFNTNINHTLFLISGGPFQLFILAPLLKLLGKKVILDFRDPFFANNRFKDGIIKSFLKRTLQRCFTNTAVHIIAVNKSIKSKLLVSRDITIIPNGSISYKSDNRVNKEQSQAPSFYTVGKIYGSPLKSVNLIKTEYPNSQFYYYGNEQLSKDLLASLTPNPPLEHSELLREVSGHNIAVLFAADNPDLTYTKIYDYLSLNQKIIVIDDNSDVSELKKLVTGYKKIIFFNSLKDKASKIQRFIEARYEVENVDRFNRRHGAEVLRQIVSSSLSPKEQQ